MSLLDVVFEPSVETQVITVKQQFVDDVSFNGVENSFSQYPKINLNTYADPTDQYEFTPRKYVADNFQAKSSYLDGISSSVQNQLDGKLNTSTASSTYQTIIPNSSFIDMTSSLQDQLDGKLDVSTASSTYQTIIPNFSFIDMTSSLQTQLNSKTTENYVNQQINNLINSAPGTLDTLGEIATILSGNVNDISTLTTSIAGKISKTANETISGILTFSQPPVMSGSSISANSIPDSALASTFLKTSDASSIYLTSASASSVYQTQSATTSALDLKANLLNAVFGGVTTIPSLITTQVSENLISTNHSSNTYTIDFSQGNTFYSTSNPSANFTVNITNIPTTTTRQYTINLLVNAGTHFCSSVSATDINSGSIYSGTPKNAWGTSPVVHSLSVCTLHTFVVVPVFGTKYIIYSTSSFY